MTTPPTGLNHIAMSVAPGTLTDAYCDEFLALYSDAFGWRSMDEFRLPDRLTISTGRHTYINIRERDDVMTTHGYEHFGMVMASPDAVEALWNTLAADPRDLNLEPLNKGDDGYRSFRFRYLLPLAVEVMGFPPGE